MKEKFINSVIILLIGGLLTKLLGMFIKIMMSRLIGTEGLGLYMMVLPTFSLFIGIGQFGLPTALSKLVAEKRKNNIKLFFSILPISLFINLLLIITIIVIAPVLANNLLHDPRCYLPILAIAVVIPFTSLSSIYLYSWRRVRDSNPGNDLAVHSISSATLSTTQTTLHFVCNYIINLYF